MLDGLGVVDEPERILESLGFVHHGAVVSLDHGLQAFPEVLVTVHPRQKEGDEVTEEENRLWSSALDLELGGDGVEVLHDERATRVLDHGRVVFLNCVEVCLCDVDRMGVPKGSDFAEEFSRLKVLKEPVLHVLLLQF